VTLALGLIISLLFVITLIIVIVEGKRKRPEKTVYDYAIENAEARNKALKKEYDALVKLRQIKAENERMKRKIDDFDTERTTFDRPPILYPPTEESLEREGGLSSEAYQRRHVAGVGVKYEVVNTKDNKQLYKTLSYSEAFVWKQGNAKRFYPYQLEIRQIIDK